MHLQVTGTKYNLGMERTTVINPRGLFLSMKSFFTCSVVKKKKKKKQHQEEEQQESEVVELEESSSAAVEVL